MSSYRISPEHDATPEVLQIIRNNLNEYNTAQLGFWDARPVAFFVRDEKNQIVGGLTGWTYFDWLAVSFLWVRQDLRGHGLGSQLLREAKMKVASGAVIMSCWIHSHFKRPNFIKIMVTKNLLSWMSSQESISDIISEKIGMNRVIHLTGSSSNPIKLSLRVG